jgi:hypothetical protein
MEVDDVDSDGARPNVESDGDCWDRVGNEIEF